jgi:hypothetical protein
MSMMVAFFAISTGPALIASAIFCALVNFAATGFFIAVADLAVRV